MTAPRAGPHDGNVLFLFLDGVGLGDDDPAINPLVAAELPTIRHGVGAAPDRHAVPVTASGRVFRALDAGMGYEGLPQSATGQTALLTGRNAAETMGGHYGPWPGPSLRPLLQRATLFHDAQDVGGAALANVYPPPYFAQAGRRRSRPNAPRFAADAAGVPLRELSAYRCDAAVAADLDGTFLQAFDATLTPMGPERSARVLIELARAHRFTFLDLWLTDKYGHARDQVAAKALLERFDAMLAAVLDLAPNLTVIVTSDHGNLEDVSTKGHTTNHVPLLAFGPGADAFAQARTLMDVAPAVRSLWVSPRTG
ncbi:MAG: hypothetical protein R6W77_03820 [Trueperaceae bacterium]